MAKEKPNFLRSLVEGFAVGSGVPASLLPSSIARDEAAEAQKLANALELARARTKPEKQQLIPDFGGGIDASLFGPAALSQEQPPEPTPDELQQSLSARINAIPPERLRPDKLPEYNRLKRAEQIINSEDLTPKQRAELAAQGHLAADRAMLEDAVIPEPTAETEYAKRVFHDGERAAILKGNGDLELNDKLEQAKIDSDTRLTIEKMKMKAQRASELKTQEGELAKQKEQDWSRIALDEEKAFFEESPIEKREAEWDKRWRSVNDEVNPPAGWAKMKVRQDLKDRLANRRGMWQFEESIPDSDPLDQVYEMRKDDPDQWIVEKDDAIARLKDAGNEAPTFDDIVLDIAENGSIGELAKIKRLKQERMLSEVERKQADLLRRAADAAAGMPQAPATPSPRKPGETATTIEPSPIVPTPEEQAVAETQPNTLEGMKAIGKSVAYNAIKESIKRVIGVDPEQEETPIVDLSTVSAHAKSPHRKRGPQRIKLEQAVREQLADAMKRPVGNVPQYEVDRVLSFDDVLAMEKQPKKQEGETYFQDLSEEEQAEMRKVVTPIMREEDYDALPPGEFAMDPETGLIRQKAIPNRSSEWLQEYSDIPVVSDAKSFDDIPVGEIYADQRILDSMDAKDESILRDAIAGAIGSVSDAMNPVVLAGRGAGIVQPDESLGKTAADAILDMLIKPRADVVGPGAHAFKIKKEGDKWDDKDDDVMLSDVIVQAAKIAPSAFKTGFTSARKTMSNERRKMAAESRKSIVGRRSKR